MLNPEAAGGAHHSSGRLLEISLWFFWEEKQAVHTHTPPFLQVLLGRARASPARCHLFVEGVAEQGWIATIQWS